MLDIRIFAGTAGQDFAQRLCATLGMEVSESRLTKFANGCAEVQLRENCRGRDVYIVQPVAISAQETLMELLLMIDAAKGASAARITAVIPYFAYGRSDKKDAPRISVGGRLAADLLATAGADRVLTMTLHAPQVQSFFRIPTDQLNALKELSAHLTGFDPNELCVVSPDLGNAKRANALATKLGCSVAFGVKERVDDSVVRIETLIGDVSGKHVVLFDDEISNGSTMIGAGKLALNHGACSVRVACTHGVFADGAAARIRTSIPVEEIISTDTVPRSSDADESVTTVSVAGSFAEAVRRIHLGESVSALFDQHV